jgi:eukaryotic translation initiation factor 2C
MLPRIAPGFSGGSGPGRPARGAPRGGTARGGGAARGGGPARGGLHILPTSGAHITTVGVKRPDFGTAGKPIPIYVNSFETTTPENFIYHCDGASRSDCFLFIDH